MSPSSAVRMFVNDWSKRSNKPGCGVFKFNPGEHYHCLNEKFDTLDEAIANLKTKGYAYSGLTERHVYREE